MRGFQHWVESDGKEWSHLPVCLLLHVLSAGLCAGRGGVGDSGDYVVRAILHEMKTIIFANSRTRQLIYDNRKSGLIFIR